MVGVRVGVDSKKGVAVGNAVGRTRGVAVGRGVGKTMGVRGGSGVEVLAGTGLALDADRACLMVRTKMLSRSTSAVALEAAKSTLVAKAVHAPSLWW